jgi:hypothetical protein
LPLSAGKTGDKAVEAWKVCKGHEREVRFARYKVFKGSEKGRMWGSGQRPAPAVEEGLPVRGAHVAGLKPLEETVISEVFKAEGNARAKK